MVNVILLANTHNLPSVVRDVVNLYRLFPNIKIISDQKMPITDEIKYQVSSSLTPEFSQVLASIPTEEPIIIFLSSHGYSGIIDQNHTESDGKNEYIVWNQHLILDDQFYQLISNRTALCVTDTCSSGTMWDLPFKTFDLQSFSRENYNQPKGKIVTISACSDNESAQDNASRWGYGGGLISAFIDHCLENSDVSTLSLLSYMRGRMRMLNQNTIVNCSTEKIDFPGFTIKVTRGSSVYFLWNLSKAEIRGNSPNPKESAEDVLFESKPKKHHHHHHKTTKKQKVKKCKCEKVKKCKK